MSIGKGWIAMLAALGMGAATAKASETVEPAETSAFGFEFESISGQPMPLSAFTGKVLLVVNTASQCGFTDQYSGLQQLHERYAEQGLVVIGVPSNDFGGQEPGGAEEIAQFCEQNYAIAFPLTAKATVSGDNAHPFYVWARAQKGWMGAPKWNFHKYLVNRQGELVDYFNSTTAPQSDALVKAIESTLAE